MDSESLIAVIGDASTVTGFLLTGIGKRDNNGKCNFLIVEEGKTKHEEIAETFKKFSTDPKIGIILINQSIATEIRYLINALNEVEQDNTKTKKNRDFPVSIVEIPSKEQPYDEKKDALLQRVYKLLGRD